MVLGTWKDASLRNFSLSKCPNREPWKLSGTSRQALTARTVKAWARAYRKLAPAGEHRAPGPPAPAPHPRPRLGHPGHTLPPRPPPRPPAPGPCVLPPAPRPRVAAYPLSYTGCSRSPPASGARRRRPCAASAERSQGGGRPGARAPAHVDRGRAGRAPARSPGWGSRKVTASRSAANRRVPLGHPRPCRWGPWPAAPLPPPKRGLARRPDRTRALCCTNRGECGRARGACTLSASTPGRARAGPRGRFLSRSARALPPPSPTRAWRI
ncbi:basic proline-rich protein-like [Meles meles]|uniref:basic proline-rich protein-like n=1 Tax=Meles meles TaxID=9662 RepID=UPI001E69F257|nr:basic proline-rich protein-like [Meles meles]